MESVATVSEIEAKPRDSAFIRFPPHAAAALGRVIAYYTERRGIASAGDVIRALVLEEDRRIQRERLTSARAG